MTRHHLLAAIALTITIGSAKTVFAQNTVWSSPSHGCVPGGQAIDSGLHENVAGALRFKTGSTGTFIAYCPITADINSATGDATDLLITYQDSNGTTTTADVQARLIRASRATGSVTTIDTYDSDSDSDTTAHDALLALSETLDFENYYYYVRVDLTRSGTQTISLYGVALVITTP